MKISAISRPLDAFPRTCTKCGKHYTLAMWLALPEKGSQPVPAGDDPLTEPAYRLDMRDCPEPGCRGTMAHPFGVETR